MPRSVLPGGRADNTVECTTHTETAALQASSPRAL
jgi:hypothetical protein